MFLYRVGKIILQPILNVFTPIKKLGYKEQPFDGGTMVVSNHISNFDVFVVARCFKNQSYFLCKKEMFEKKFPAFVIKKCGGLEINREKPEFSEIKECLKILKEKKRLVVFPEGTRNKSNDGNLLEIKGGSAMFAFKTQSRIIPMYIAGKSKIFKKSYVYIGEPFDFSEFYGQKFNQESSEKMSEIIRDKILECKSKFEDYINNKKLKKTNKNK